MPQKLVGLYTGWQTIVQDPGYLDALQDAVGLNLIIGGGPLALSPELRASAPGVTPQGRRGIGVDWTDDDSILRKAMDECHKRNIAVWLLVGGWHGPGDAFPELVARDLWGRPLNQVPRPQYAWEVALAICPSRPEINAWMCRAYAEIARRYDCQGVDITHARLIAPAYTPSWWSCGCESCQRRAAELGYDFAAMREGVDAFFRRLRSLTPSQARRAAEAQPGLLGLAQVLGLEGGFLDWFNFRADLISANLRQMRAAVHETAKGKMIFGSDNFPPSFALLVGHRYADFCTEASDFTSPLISHVGIFVYATLASTADLLMQNVQGLEEADALRLSYALFGYEHLKMPSAIGDYHLGQIEYEESAAPLAEIVEKEITLARALNGGQVPSYPVIKGGLWSKETVQRLIRTAEELGHEGLIFQQTGALTPYVPKG
jgi:hypothetical protein